MTSTHIFLLVLGVLLAILWIVALGLQVPPRRFHHVQPSNPGKPLPFNPDLPEPVRRHFAQTIGSPTPQIKTAVLWGGARAHVKGLWLPLRFKSWHRAGQDFYRRLEYTWFRQPFMHGEEYFINGEGMFEISGDEERGPWVDQSANLAMWAEVVWLPALLVHDPRVRWEAVDNVTARLIVPFKDGTDELTAHFDPVSGCMTDFTALRFRDVDDNQLTQAEKEPWRVNLLEWRKFGELTLPSQVAIAWGESGSPWSYWWLEGVAYNVDVSDRLRPDQS